jgi:hypothetical protein
MDRIEQIIKSLSLPLLLPEEAFTFTEEYNSPDLTYLINELPEKLRLCLDVERNAAIKRYDKGVVYRFILLGGDYLTVKVQNRSIVEVNKVPES